MFHKVFTIYDSKSDAYLQPFFLHTTGQAVRAISDCVNDPKHQFAKHPADYTLFEIGTFDDSSCLWTPLPQKLTLHGLIELLNPELPFVLEMDKPNEA